MIKTKIIFLFLFALCFLRSARAFLDGRVNPIYLENTYTLTDGDWALGWVYFERVLIIPAGASVHLGIIPAIEYQRNTNSTGKIYLEKDLHLALDVLKFTAGYFEVGPTYPSVQPTLFFDKGVEVRNALKFTGSSPMYIELQGNWLSFSKIHVIGSGWANAPGFINQIASEVTVGRGSFIFASDNVGPIPIFRHNADISGSRFRFSNMDFYLDGDITYTYKPTGQYIPFALSDDNSIQSYDNREHNFTLGDGQQFATNGPASLKIRNLVKLVLSNTPFSYPENMTFDFDGGSLITNGSMTFQQMFLRVSSFANFTTDTPGSVLTLGDGASISNDTGVYINPGASMVIGSGLEVRYKNIH